MELHQDGTLEGPTQPTPQRARRRLAGALGVALLVGLTVGVSAAAANSPSAKPEAGATITVGAGPVTAGTPADVEKLDAAFAEYRDCMAEHGIDMPEPVRVQGGAVDPGGAPISGVAPVSGGTFVTGTGASLTGDPMPAFDAAAFAAADTACAPILEAAGIRTFSSSSTGEAGGPVLGAGGGVIVGAAVLGGQVGGPGDLAAMVAPMKKYATCMRDHGVNIPDPVVDETAGTFEMKVDVDPTTSEFRAADAACADGGFSFAVPVAPAGQ